MKTIIQLYILTILFVVISFRSFSQGPPIEWQNTIRIYLLAFLFIFLSHNAPAQQLKWAQYVGGSKDDYLEAVAVDHHGNIIISGATKSKGLASIGAYQEVKSAGNDFLISKYRSDGTLVWATYYGGNASDYSFTMTVDRDDNIYVGGETQSTDMASANAYQITK
jgi:hypothetical protein